MESSRNCFCRVQCRVNQQVQNYKTCLKNWHFGVEKFNFSLGLSFNFFCIDIILLSVYWLKDSFFGIYCLINLFVFSIVPFCHEQYGSAKYTGTAKYFVILMCRKFRSIISCNGLQAVLVWQQQFSNHLCRRL